MGIAKLFKRLLSYLKKKFWTEQVAPQKKEKQKIPAKDVAKNHVIIYYKGQPFQLLRSEVARFHSLPTKSKKMMVRNFNDMIKKKKIELVEIDGVKRYVKTRGYDYSKHFISDRMKKEVNKKMEKANGR